MCHTLLLPRQFLDSLFNRSKVFTWCTILSQRVCSYTSQFILELWVWLPITKAFCSSFLVCLSMLELVFVSLNEPVLYERGRMLHKLASGESCTLQKSLPLLFCSLQTAIRDCKHGKVNVSEHSHQFWQWMVVLTRDYFVANDDLAMLWNWFEAVFQDHDATLIVPIVHDALRMPDSTHPSNS